MSIITRKVGVIVGSLRKESFTRKVAKELIRLAPDSLDAEIVEIGDLTIFNQDLDDKRQLWVLHPTLELELSEASIRTIFGVSKTELCSAMFAQDLDLEVYKLSRKESNIVLTVNIERYIKEMQPFFLNKE